jgi:AraC-like DNA-binding protein
VLAREGETTVELENGRQLTGKALLIRPAVIHQIVGSREVGLICVEPQAPLAFSLKDLIGPEDAELLPWTVAQYLDPAAEPSSWIAALRGALPNPTRKLDPRIKEAMKWLAANPVPNAIALAAKSCGLSDSHLRALARTQLGFPLSTWLVWRKLERAVYAMAEGLSLAEAATAAGFSDQAHCARTMRRMFGVTPTVARATLRCGGIQTALCGGTTPRAKAFSFLFNSLI